MSQRASETKNAYLWLSEEQTTAKLFKWTWHLQNIKENIWDNNVSCLAYCWEIAEQNCPYLLIYFVCKEKLSLMQEKPDPPIQMTDSLYPPECKKNTGNPGVPPAS